MIYDIIRKYNFRRKMIQKSEWIGFEEMFELTESGVISFLKKKIEFIEIFEISRYSIPSDHEKKLIKDAKSYFNSILKYLQDSKNSLPFSEDECLELMDEVHKILMNIIEFIEFEFLN